MPTSSASLPPAKSRGWHVAAFLEQFCRPTQGEWAGQQLHLLPWQRTLLDDLFEIDPLTGLRRYRKAYIGVPRKNGKSTLCSGLGLYGLLMDGEPGAQVFAVAGDRQQARAVFDEARAMVEADPFLSERIRTFRYHLEDPETHSIFRVLSADAKRQQGLNPSFVIFDEVHVQPDEQLWSAMTLGGGTRRQPLVIGITTAGFDRDSLAWRLYEHGKRIESGEVEDRSFFYRWWEPSNPNCAPDDRQAWAEANPSLGAFLKTERLEDDLGSTLENEFRRYHLNQWTTTRDAWLPHGAWAACEDKTRVVSPDEPIVIGFDGSWTDDSTAMVGCTVNNPHLFKIRLWEPAQGDRVDSGDVEAAVLDAVSAYNVAEIACDPHQWREPIARWQNIGLPVIEWPTNSVARMVPACTEFQRAVLEKRITHDGDPALARHIANAVVKVDRFGGRIVKDTSKRKIDAAVAAVIAHDRISAHVWNSDSPGVTFID